jgi:aryl-alcohol dehydrogenase-like predicted oxidoreductase
MSTRIIFGGAAIRSATQDQADAILDLLLEYGVNHLDTAPTYGDAELRIGPWMPRYRDRFFLATKTIERTYQKAWAELHQSLERLQTDQIDLWQLHALIDPGEWETAMGSGGALEAAIEAREQGLIRFIGVTGHGATIPAMHRRSLERFNSDAVLLPYNYVVMQDPQYAADFEALIKMCRARNVAVQTIKSMARRPWGEQTKTHGSWYQPFETQEDVDRAVGWVLSRPEVFLNTTGDLSVQPMILDAAARFQGSISDDEMAAMAERLEMAPIFEGTEAIV